MQCPSACRAARPWLLSHLLELDPWMHTDYAFSCGAVTLGQSRLACAITTARSRQETNQKLLDNLMNTRFVSNVARGSLGSRRIVSCREGDSGGEDGRGQCTAGMLTGMSRTASPRGCSRSRSASASCCRSLSPRPACSPAMRASRSASSAARCSRRFCAFVGFCRAHGHLSQDPQKHHAAGVQCEA